MLWHSTHFQYVMQSSEKHTIWLASDNQSRKESSFDDNVDEFDANKCGLAGLQQESGATKGNTAFALLVFSFATFLIHVVVVWGTFHDC